MIKLIDKWFNNAVYLTVKIDNTEELKIFEKVLNIRNQKGDVLEVIWGNPYFTILEKINLLCKWLTVHSIIYYVHHTNIVSDQIFDNNCKQLVNMIENNPEIFKESHYHYYMHDFDGSTGFDLPNRLNLHHAKIMGDIADNLIRRHLK